MSKCTHSRIKIVTKNNYEENPIPKIICADCGEPRLEGDGVTGWHYCYKSPTRLLASDKEESCSQSEDNVDHPEHYNSLDAECIECGNPIECIDVVRNMSFNLGNAIKYIWRCDEKGKAVEDLKKAIWYLQDEIRRREGV